MSGHWERNDDFEFWPEEPKKIGVFDPKLALSMECWSIPTVVANTIYYFANMKYFK